MFLKNAIGRRVSIVSLALAIFVVLAAPACYIPGIINPTEATDQPEGAPTGEPEILYGKFIFYTVGNGKIQKLGGGKVDYFVGDEVYFPDSVKDQSADYNFLRIGNEPSLTYHYKDTVQNLYVASGRPETIVLHRKGFGDQFRPTLAMFYTDPRLDWLEFGRPYENNGLVDLVGDTPATATPITPVDTSLVFYANFSFKGDVDVYSMDVTAQTILAIQGRFTQLYGFDDLPTGDRHRLQLRLLDSSGAEIARSGHGLDFFKYVDPDLTVVIPSDGTYYLEVSDIKRPLEDPSVNDFYRILFETSADPGTGHIKKGEIQPARSCRTSIVAGETVFTGCSHQLQGGATFEPDNLKTEIKDIWPDCDGIPGSGDEGDAGIYEMCGSITDLGAGDGKTEYQEVDDKSTIDDGEYFVGQPTNVPAFVDSEASIIKTPDDHDLTTRDSLSMFVSYNSGIYWLESLDGETGMVWDLSNLHSDRPAVTPLSRRSGGNPRTPVITSGALGFCDTAPDSHDIWGAPELEQFADIYGVSATSTGSFINSPSGYPNTVAITFGSNAFLDSQPLVDEAIGDTIDSGDDGIINTFFAPRYVAYSQPKVPNSSAINPIPQIFPGNTFSTTGMNGPGTPDNPRLYDSTVPGYVFPLLPYGGDDQHAFLLGDDEWNPAIFRGDTLTPAAYWRKQHCHFYSIGSNFDRCAMGVPEDANGEEPVTILPGEDGQLDTVNQLLKKFRGDDVLCHEGNTVGICPGPDGRFGWQDVYIPLKGDDRIAVVYDGGTATVGISSGPDAILETQPISGYSLVDLENFTIYRGGDIACLDAFGNPAICAGSAEEKRDLYDNSDTPTGIHRLMTIWPMYITSLSYPEPDIFGQKFFGKKDLYNMFDDEFCIINGSPAICPGQDGIFQSYPLTQRVQVDEDDDLFVLHDRVKGMMGKDCYSLQSELYTDSFSKKEAVRYVFYHDLGIRMDDRVRWSASRGYYITSGKNGINQSCTVASDERVIPMWQGLADQPIITPGADGIFQTYALKDEKFKWADNVWKINSGPDGISNSYVRGDDRLEIFMGTGKADQPCVRSGDGMADTYAQNYTLGFGAPIWTNDRQIYNVGERTGFDAFEVFGPKAEAVGNQIYLYYSALGWEEYPEMFRNSADSLADVGECRRPGFDLAWGKRSSDLSLRQSSDLDKSLYNYDLQFLYDDFKRLLDNNEAVGIEPRIGLAISSIDRLRSNPTDWDIRPMPVLDVGQQCAGSFSSPINLPLTLPGKLPDSNFYGAYSPEIEFSETPDGRRLFLMFYTGLSQGEQDSANLQPTAAVGLARSFDGIHWEMVRDFKLVLTSYDFDVNSLLGSSGDSPQYSAPSIYLAGEDQYGQDMYGMFFNTYISAIGKNNGYRSQNVDFHTQEHIGWALRRGMSTISSCSMSPDTFADSQDRNRRILQIIILALPVALAGIFGLSRRRRKA